MTGRSSAKLLVINADADSASGSIVVNGITDTNSDSVGTVNLIANKHAKTITFETGVSTFNKGIVLVASGVDIAVSVTTQSQAVSIATGTGTLSLRSGKSLSTSNQMLSITTDDLGLQGSAGSLSTGAIHCVFTAL